MRPAPKLLDTDSGESCLEGVALAFAWLGKSNPIDGGFYLGIDSDTWDRGLYYEPPGVHEGFYCFDIDKMAQLDSPMMRYLAADLARWRETGSTESVRELLDMWSAYEHDAHACLLTEENE